ncbi:sensor histidine kinase [Streptacidiphilus jiangxiensis]|uniref:Two-component system, NarL family, sensor histidine kinase DesK n=1 Tax=Streptacidiphilus jiangxiensis TaxID=235985 RepID=A0A1H7JNN6_STRJI|nr:histidine kinase [Streptacidiphilus jiangxiensis]SEK75936.1 two-component system, NarL family, sensor histidine kinase DesK [Streptacidiphilus jiangxiensis]
MDIDGATPTRSDAVQEARIQEPDVPPLRLARAILAAVLTSYILITILNLLSSRLSGGLLAMAGCCLAAVACLQYLHSKPDAARASRRRRALTLGLQAALTYLPLLALHAEWGSMAGFLAGSLLLLLPPRAAWPLYGLVCVTMVVEPVLEGRSVVDCAYLGESTMLTGLVVYGLTRLTQLVVHVQATRGQLARLAVANERLRFARDLHDLLGYSLSAITLKSELLLRLIPGHPGRAEQEIGDILTLSRQSLADVRQISRGYRDMSLLQEIESARSMLEAAGIQVVAACELGELTPDADTVLATVLREGVTNVLRHSRVRNCSIDAGGCPIGISLTLTNDGVVDGVADRSPHSGSGLSNLRMRLEAVGGRLSTEATGDGRFRLQAEVPREYAELRQRSGGTGRGQRSGTTIPAPAT